MFYVKESLNDAMDVSIEITDENVFCHCPMCSTEVSVDIAAVFCDGEGDLYSTSVYCNDCSKKIRIHGREVESL